MGIVKNYFKRIKEEFKMLPELIKYVLSKKRKAIYVGCTGMGNLGDEAVFLSISKMLNNLIFYNILYSKPNAGKIGRRLFINSPDYIFLGGGTIIKKSAKSGYLKIINKLIQEYPKAKVIVFGAGVADPDLACKIGFPTNVSDWSVFLNKCSFIAVRGILSQKILKTNEWAFKKDIYILHDPAIYLSNKEVLQKPMSKKIGINFCDIVGRIYGGDEKAVEAFANNLISDLIDNSWNVYLYPTVDTDISYMKKIIDSDKLSKITILDNFSDIEKALDFFKHIDIFVGQRLHSIVFSSMTYTPFHAIEYESKMSDFLLSLGLSGYSTRTDVLNVEFVMERINYLYTNLADEQTKLFELCEKAKKEQNEISLNFINNYN